MPVKGAAPIRFAPSKPLTNQTMTGNNSGAHPLTNPELRDRRGNDAFIFVASQCAVILEDTIGVIRDRPEPQRLERSRISRLPRLSGIAEAQTTAWPGFAPLAKHGASDQAASEARRTASGMGFAQAHFAMALIS